MKSLLRLIRQLLNENFALAVITMSSLIESQMFDEQSYSAATALATGRT